MENERKEASAKEKGGGRRNTSEGFQKLRCNDRGIPRKKILLHKRKRQGSRVSLFKLKSLRL